MDTQGIISLLKNVIAKISEEKLYLTELDNVIGDGDHGINMARGFSAVESKIESMETMTPSEVLKQIGFTLMSTVGGAAGPLYGTAFMSMSKTLVGIDNVTIKDFLVSLQSAIDGVSMRGKSQKGEKTMLDSMIPACIAMNEELNLGKTPKEILQKGVKAAWDGVEFTKTIAATKGRASYLGDRSIGHQDPGATSFTMMLEELEKLL